MRFTPFDPLEAKNNNTNDATSILKREIENILSSYVGWYDPFCELIQNALDAGEARIANENAAGTGASYEPKIDILIDIDDNALTITDNGIGLDEDKFKLFLAPSLSFKSGNTRGHKGVGATYVAYGFNYMRISTKVPGFKTSGRIVGARNWIKNNAAGGSPKVEPDDLPQVHAAFDNNDRGVSITVRFDENTHPRKLGWIRADTAAQWSKILSIKTGLGSIVRDKLIQVTVTVRAMNKVTTLTTQGTSYLWLHEEATKKASFQELQKEQELLLNKFGAGRKMPDKYQKLDFIYATWTADELESLLKTTDEEELDVIAKYSPTVSVEFGYTAKLWNRFNETTLGIRSGRKVLTSGIQLAANNMPQGEVIQVQLNRNIGRQNQVHFLIHFNNYTPDLGRKGFHRELIDFSKSVT